MKLDGVRVHLVLRGKPVTKKNHPQIGRAGGKPRVFPSKAYRQWVKEVEVEMISMYGRVPVQEPVNVRALIYRSKKIGDTNGFYQAIGDFLELCTTCAKRKCSCGQEDYLLADDRWIASWDGSRRLKDKDNPRIEIWITGVDYE